MCHFKGLGVVWVSLLESLIALNDFAKSSTSLPCQSQEADKTGAEYTAGHAHQGQSDLQQVIGQLPGIGPLQSVGACLIRYGSIIHTEQIID